MSIEAIEAYPLTWPDGWRRTPPTSRARAKFGRREVRDAHSYASAAQLTVAQAVGRVLEELERMRVPRYRIVVSTNVRTQRDGLPRSGEREPTDPGASVYWMEGKQRRCMAIDRYDRVADNLAAIAATLSAMRAIEHHGGAEILDRAFTGFVALPAPEQWWQVLEVPATATRSEIEAAHRRLAMKHHPDRGGSDAEMARVNAARDAGLEARE